MSDTVHLQLHGLPRFCLPLTCPLFTADLDYVLTCRQPMFSEVNGRAVFGQASGDSKGNTESFRT